MLPTGVSELSEPWAQKIHSWSKCHALLYLSMLWAGSTVKCRSGNVTGRMTATMLTQHFRQCLKTVTIVPQNDCWKWENLALAEKPQTLWNETKSILVPFILRRLCSYKVSATRRENTVNHFTKMSTDLLPLHFFLFTYADFRKKIKSLVKFQVNQFRPDV